MTYEVETDVMASAASKIGNAADEIKTVLDSLRVDVNDMFGGWSGDGATAHGKLHERFDIDANAILSNLQMMQESLIQTRSVYVTQETEQTSDGTFLRNRIV